MGKAVYKDWDDLKESALNRLPQGFHPWLHAFDGEPLTDEDLATLSGLIDAYVKRVINEQTFTIQFESVFVGAKNRSDTALRSAQS